MPSFCLSHPLISSCIPMEPSSAYTEFSSPVSWTEVRTSTISRSPAAMGVASLRQGVELGLERGLSDSKRGKVASVKGGYLGVACVDEGLELIGCGEGLRCLADGLGPVLLDGVRLRVGYDRVNRDWFRCHGKVPYKVTLESVTLAAASWEPVARSVLVMLTPVAALAMLPAILTDWAPAAFTLFAAPVAIRMLL